MTSRRTAPTAAGPAHEDLDGDVDHPMPAGHRPGLRHLVEILAEDLEAAHAHDPAARSRFEVALGYPGVHAVWAHRVTHRMWHRPGLRLPARLLSQVARWITGIEIHPGARIGRRLFIDHGMGVVIGQTAVVGDDCVLFHGSTLGGRSMTRGKRHPTLGNRVMVGAGAKILGPLWIGDDAQIGANAVVTRDVPNGMVAVGVPAHARTPGHRPDHGQHVEDASELLEYVI